MITGDDSSITSTVARSNEQKKLKRPAAAGCLLLILLNYPD